MRNALPEKLQLNRTRSPLKANNITVSQRQVMSDQLSSRFAEVLWVASFGGAFSVLLAWVYNGAGGSVLLAMLMHGLIPPASSTPRTTLP